MSATSMLAKTGEISKLLVYYKLIIAHVWWGRFFLLNNKAS